MTKSLKIETYQIDTEAEAKAYLTDLLDDPRNQSRSVVEARCAKMVKDPAVRQFFLAEGERMLAERQGRATDR